MEQALVDPRLVGDLLHAGARVAFPDKHPFCRFQYPAFRVEVSVHFLPKWVNMFKPKPLFIFSKNLPPEKLKNFPVSFLGEKN
jgi:hypothetical protein